MASSVHSCICPIKKSFRAVKMQQKPAITLACWKLIFHFPSEREGAWELRNNLDPTAVNLCKFPFYLSGKRVRPFYVSGKRASTVQSLSEQTLGQGNWPKSFQRSKILMAHLNIRSLKNRDHLVQLQMLTSEKGFDVLAISESWLNSTVSNAGVEISGYKLFRQDRLRKKGGCVYVNIRTSLEAKVLKKFCAISNSGFQHFGLKFNTKSGKFFCHALFTDLQTVLCPALVTILWKTTCILLRLARKYL